ncbi:hypothetical protein EPUL_006341, partial [Erysiphe pulchra]
MAPLLGFKRALPPDPPDAGNRVSKSTSTTSKANNPSILKACSFPRIAEALHRSIVFDPERCATQDSDNEQIENSVEFEDQELPIQTVKSINYEEDFPSLEELDRQKKNLSYADSNKTTQGDKSMLRLPDVENGETIPLKKQLLRGNQPGEKSKEDRCVIIRLDQNHEAGKCNPFQLRQTIQKLVPDKGLISDVWTVPIGIAIIAPTPSKVAAIMQYKKEIETWFGKATVERQETWITFEIGPIPKKAGGLDGFIDPMNGSLLEELGSIRDHVPIRHIGRTRRSLDYE